MSKDRIFQFKDGTLTLIPSEDDLVAKAEINTEEVSASLTVKYKSKKERDQRVKNFSSKNARPLFELILERVMENPLMVQVVGFQELR